MFPAKDQKNVFTLSVCCFSIFTSFCLHTATQASCFSNAIGVANKSVVSHNVMTASTRKTNYSAKHGRLNGNRAWCAQSANGTQEWLKIELEKSTEICGVATQGREDTDEYVISFNLNYSLDGGGLTAYQNSNGYDEVNLLFSLEGRCNPGLGSSVVIKNILAGFLSPGTIIFNPYIQDVNAFKTAGTILYTAKESVFFFSKPV